MNGARKLLNCLTSHVGTGSNEQCLLAALAISFSTSETVTGVHAVSLSLADFLGEELRKSFSIMRASITENITS